MEYSNISYSGTDTSSSSIPVVKYWSSKNYQYSSDIEYQYTVEHYGTGSRKKIWIPKNVQDNSILIFFDHENIFFYFSDPYKLVKIMFCHVGP